MSKSLEQILGYVALTGTIQATKTGIPNPLPPAFSANPRPTIGDSGRYTQVTGTRTTARQAMYGAPARNTALKDVADKDVKLIHSIESIEINVRIMNMLRNYTNYDLQKQGEDEVTRQAQEFRQRFLNHRLAAMQMVLNRGIIYYDSEGNLLPSSSGNSFGVDFGMSANNTGQGLEIDGTTALISASWATNTTDIAGDIQRIRKTALRRTGYPLRYAFYGTKVPGNFAKNTTIQAFFARNTAKNQYWLDTNQLPEMFGLIWVPAFESFYEDQNGSFQDIWGPDDVVFTPEPESSWWEILEGTYPVPTTLNILNDAIAANNAFENIQGMGGFAVPAINPPAAFMATYFDTFLPVLKVPNAIFPLDTTP